MSNEVLVDTLPLKGGKKLGLITLNRAKVFNSLSLEMIDIMLSQLRDWQQDSAVIAIFLSGAGDKAFCAGGDVQKMYYLSIEASPEAQESLTSFFEREYRLNYLIHSYTKPIICWGDGIVMGGGLGLMAGASHRIVTERSRLAMPEITIGFYPDVGGSWFLNKLPEGVGLFLALTSAPLNATDSLLTGLADQAVDSSCQQLLLDSMATADWGATEGHHSSISALIGKMKRAALAESNLKPHLPLIQSSCRGVQLTEVVAAITAIESDSNWLNKAKTLMQKGSPLAAQLIFKQLLDTVDYSLAEVFQSELVLSVNIAKYAEFAEGVRALLIDKDRSPQWRFDTIEAVPSDTVQQFFRSPWELNPLHDIEVSIAL